MSSVDSIQSRYVNSTANYINFIFYFSPDRKQRKAFRADNFLFEVALSLIQQGIYRNNYAIISQ